jgi:hypothetical protein
VAHWPFGYALLPSHSDAVAHRAAEGGGDRRVRQGPVDARRRVAVRAGRTRPASKATAARICEQLRERYQAFKRRDLYTITLAALFLDATFIAVRHDGPKEGALVAWGFTEAGERVLLSVTLGMRESYEDLQALGRDLIARGLGAPLLIVAEGAPGLVKAIVQCWPASDRQRCCVHRARNLYAKLPERERERVKHPLLAGARRRDQRKRRQAETPDARRRARQARLHRRSQMPGRRSRRARGAPALPATAPPQMAEHKPARKIARRGEEANQGDGPLPRPKGASRSSGPCLTSSSPTRPTASASTSSTPSASSR